MFEAEHEIYLDIFKVPFRPCRPFQEKIADYTETGRARFQWEKIYQRWMIYRDTEIADTCVPCPMNLFPAPLGCEGHIPGLRSLWTLLEKAVPESALLKMKEKDNLILLDAVQDLAEEMKSLPATISLFQWPVAQVFFLGQPVYVEGLLSTVIPLLFEWNGQEEPGYQYSSAGYLLGRTQEGIILRETTGELLPQTFRRLWREGGPVYGETIEGEIMMIPAFNGVLPAWDSVDPCRDSQLMALEISAQEAFSRPLNLLKAFVDTAIYAKTGLGIRSIY
ncbi:MAG: hypothetical protein V2A78_05225 [bacterium]